VASFKEIEERWFLARDERVGPGQLEEISLALERQDGAEHPRGRTCSLAGQVDNREMQSARAIERSGRTGEVGFGEGREAELTAPAVDVWEQAAGLTGEGDDGNVGVACIAAHGEAADAHRAERLRLPVGRRGPGE
jgi:hypothetical protein